MEDYNPKTVYVSELKPGHRFYFFGRICEIYTIDALDVDLYTIWFGVPNDRLDCGTMTLKGTSDFVILLNKE